MKIFCLLVALMLLLSSPAPEMLLLIALLFLTALPDRSRGEEDEEDEEDEEEEVTEGKEKEKEKVNTGGEKKVGGGTEEEEGEEEEGEEEDEKNLPPSGVSLKLQQEIIDKHNAFRRAVKPPARNMLKMVWDENIAIGARQFADTCPNGKSDQKERVENGTFCGEVLFQANYVIEWKEVLDFWNKKGSNFKYGVGAIDPTLNIHPYTQMIWYNSYRVGCAANLCPGEHYTFFYVCRYCPAGNFNTMIETPYKKGKSCGDCPKNCEKKLCTNPCKYMDVSFDCKKQKEVFSCRNPKVKKNCRATCRCKSSTIA